MKVHVFDHEGIFAIAKDRGENLSRSGNRHYMGVTEIPEALYYEYDITMRDFRRLQKEIRRRTVVA